MESTKEEGAAHLINNMVNSRTITGTDASKATASQIDELVLRTTRSGLDTKKNQDKVRRIFNSELLTHKLTNNELRIIRRKSIALLQKLLLTFNEKHYVGADGENPPNLMGFIVTGSLFNPDKIPTKDSDLDVISVGINIGQEALTFDANLLQKKMGLSLGEDIDLTHTIRPDEIFKPLTQNGWQISDVLKLSDNRGILYIGSLPIPHGVLKDNDATVYLRDYLNSSELKLLRKDYIQKEEQKL